MEMEAAPITADDVIQALVRQGQTADLIGSIVFSNDSETAFVQYGGFWHLFDLVDGWALGRQIAPGYIPSDRIDHFREWLDKRTAYAYREGRRYGENEMRGAIRSLIGAADLVDLTPKDDY